MPDSWWCQHFQSNKANSKESEYQSHRKRELTLPSQRWLYAMKQNCRQNWILLLSMEIAQVWGGCVLSCCFFFFPVKFLISKTPWSNGFPFLITYPVKMCFLSSPFHFYQMSPCPWIIWQSKHQFLISRLGIFLCLLIQALTTYPKRSAAISVLHLCPGLFQQ